MNFEKSLHALRALNHKWMLLEAEFFEECHFLEQKYNEKMEKIFKMREKIISGEHVPCDDEFFLPLSEESREGIEIKKLLEEMKCNSTSFKGIPKFWLRVLKSCPRTSDYITVSDGKILEYLNDIRVKLICKPMGFILEFHFDENPYFEDNVLTKTYYTKPLTDDDDPYNYDGPSIIGSRGVPIKWKVYDDTGATYFTAVIGKFFSFFDIFNDSVGTCGKDSCGLQNDLVTDYEVGYFIKAKLVPKALKYYLNLLDEDDQMQATVIEEEYSDDMDSS